MSIRKRKHPDDRQIYHYADAFRNPTAEVIELDTKLNGEMLHYFKSVHSEVERFRRDLTFLILPGLLIGGALLTDPSSWIGSQIFASMAMTLAIVLIIVAGIRNWRDNMVRPRLVKRLFFTHQFLKYHEKCLQTVELQRTTNEQVARISRAARLLPQAVGSHHPKVVDNANRVASGFLSLQIWVSQPQPQTRLDLIAEIELDLSLMAQGRWYELRQEDYVRRPIRPYQRALLVLLAIMVLGGVVVVGIWGAHWGLGQTAAMTTLTLIAIALLSKAGITASTISNAQDITSKLKG